MQREELEKESPQSPQSGSKPTAEKSPHGWCRRVAYGIAFVALSGAALAWAADGGDTHGWFHGAGHCHGRDHGQMAAHAERFTGHLLGRIDASEAQTREVKSIVARTVADLGDLRGDRKALRELLVRELTAPTVNRAALDRLRVEKLETMEAASRVIVDALADVADVLSADQRMQLAEVVSDFHH